MNSFTGKYKKAQNMGIKKILDNANKSNIADGLDNDLLVEIGNEVVKGHNDDLGTMSDWSEVIEKGLDLAKFEIKAKEFPWKDSANFKSPVIFEAVRDFGDRANSEILRNKDLVAIDKDIDNDPEVDALADRVAKHMNYQINKKIPNWRKKQGKAFYPLSAMGAGVKKTFFDPNIGDINSEWIMYPNFSVNNKCSDFDEVTRFTHIRKFTANDVFTRINSGMWIDFDFIEHSENIDDDGYFTFLEQYCEYDIDDDGYKEPYIITVHKESCEVVRIAPRYSEQDVYIQYENKTQRALDVAFALEDKILNNELLDQDSMQEYFKEDLAKAYRSSKLVRIEPENLLTLYNFLVPIDGTLLGCGFLHVMGNQAKSINLSTNDLFNSATLSNLQFGFLSKEHRTNKRGSFKVEPARWENTNISADKLASSVLPMPVKEPSATLLQLNEILKSDTQALGTKTNIGDAVSPNVPAISVLGMLQEGIIPTSALIGRVIESMSCEFKVIADLNAIYTDPKEYRAITGNKEADYSFDYNTDIIDVTPTANSQFASQFQRVQMAQVQMETVPLLIQAQANPIPIIKNYFDAIGSELGEQVFAKPSEEDDQRLQQMQAMQQAQLQAMQQQNQIMEKQFQLAQREQELKHERETLKQEKEIFELQAKIQKDSEELIHKADKTAQEFALKLTELEAKYNRDLNASVADNILVFNPETGEFENDAISEN